MEAALPFLILVVGLLELGLEYKWRDRRTRANRRVRYGMVVSMVLVAAMSVYVANTNQRELQTAEEQREQLQSSLDKARTQRDALQASVSEVSDRLEPFLALAREIRPDASETEALAALQSQIRELRDQAASIDGRTPRGLSPEQREILLRSLKPNCVGERKMGFMSDPDPEAHTFGKRLQRLFSEAGWSTHYVVQIPLSTRSGLFFLVKQDKLEGCAKQALEALLLAGLRIDHLLDWESHYSSWKDDHPNWAGPRPPSDESVGYALVVGPKDLGP